MEMVDKKYENVSENLTKFSVRKQTPMSKQLLVHDGDHDVVYPNKVPKSLKENSPMLQILQCT